VLKNISLIASVICGLTALTTSLRALGKSREEDRRDIETLIKTSCRVSSSNKRQENTARGSLLIYLVVTIIWFLLSVVFISPYIYEFWMDGKINAVILWLSPFLLLTIALMIIWQHVKRHGNRA
jgi:polyferredoxin